MLIAKHFQFRVELFFKTIVLDGRFRKTNYYAIRVEFQVRGSPHINSSVWILNALKLTSSFIPEYMEWLDIIIRTNFPNPNTEPQLYELFKTYQIH